MRSTSNLPPSFLVPAPEERIIVVLALLALASQMMPQFLFPNADVLFAQQPGGIFAFQLVYGVIYTVSAILLLTRWRIAADVAFRDPWLLALLGLAGLSILWSEWPMISLRRVAALYGGFVLALYIVVTFSRKEWLTLLAWALGLAGLLSLLLGLLLPEFAIHSEDRHDIFLQYHPGAWRGIFIHKNLLGSHMVIGLLAIITLLAVNEHYRHTLLLLAVIMTLLLAFSASRSSWVLASLLPLIYLLRKAPWHHWISQRGFIVWLSLMAGLACAIIIFSMGDHILSLLGRDVTLTGRIPLWTSLWSSVTEKFFFGHGYGAYWLDWNPSLQVLRETLEWPVTHSHNGFMEVSLDLGILGTLLLAASLIRATANALRSAAGSSDPIEQAFLYFLILILVANLTESYFLKHNNLIWVLYMILALSIEPHPRSNDRHAASQQRIGASS